MVGLRGIVLGVVLGVLAGCCQTAVKRDTRPLPAAITQEEQVRRLEEWSRQMPRLRATTVLAGVRFDYRDDQGKAHSQNAEGTLLIRQHFEEASASGAVPTADVLLLGKAFDQPVFEAGRNAKEWWFLIRLDTKTAWVGDATRQLDPATLSSKSSASILRADLVPELLGLSELGRGAGPGGKGLEAGQVVVMRVNDVEGTNELLIEEPAGRAGGGTGRAYIAREIIVDRRSGQIREVRVYDPTAALVVRSQLEDYAAVAFPSEGDKPAGGIPQFPRRVTVTYPGQSTTIALHFETVTVPARVPAAAFETPDFAREGLKVVHAE